ncbi:hypothetical protein JTB14_027328 [Gonioctena quinquepunctata]|nr:hypothetical protein JTB14_027328 [Gonioctena quinquepunctata]
MKSSDSSKTPPDRQPHSPLCLPDMPLPTPPPMANIMMTSRFDLQTRGGCGYRRILSARSNEFRSPILSRASVPQNLDYRSPILGRHHMGIVEEMGLSPLPRHRNFEDLSEWPSLSLAEKEPTPPPRSKYLSRDSLLSQELEEVQNLSRELSSKFSEPHTDEVSPEYQNVFYNEHYISDIDENEEIKEFFCEYNIPERRHSDHSDRGPEPSAKSFGNYNTLPSLSSSKGVKSGTQCQFGEVSRSSGSNSSIKSSDYYVCSPLTVRRVNQSDMTSKGVLKSPHRPVVKIAKIRYVLLEQGEKSLLLLLFRALFIIMYSDFMCDL